MSPEPGEDLFQVVRAPTLTQQAYDYLLEEIVNGRVAPGARIIERTVASALGLSKTPVREALNRLERESLIVLRPQRGAEVRRLSLEEARNIMELRIELSSYAAGRAAQRIEQAEVERLQGALRELEGAAAPTLRRGDYRRADLRIHRLIEQAADNDLLVRMLDQMRNQIRLFMVTTTQIPGRIERSLAEHRALVENVTAGRPLQACEAARHHLEATWEAMRGHWQNQAR